MNQAIADAVAAAFDDAGLTTEALTAAWPREWRMRTYSTWRAWHSGDITVHASRTPDAWFAGAEFQLALLVPSYESRTTFAVVQGTDFGALLGEARARVAELAKLVGMEEAESRRVSREDRLRALGFEEPSEEQRREQLARNVAMRDWQAEALAADNARLRALVARGLEVARDNQWAGHGMCDTCDALGACPECGASAPRSERALASTPHARDCALAAFIRDAEALTGGTP